MWQRWHRWLSGLDLDPRSYRFAAEPTPATSADYGAARAAWLDRARSCAALAAVYEFGSVTVPGISDIDFVAVLRDQPGDTDCTALSIRDLSPRHRELFLHDPVVLAVRHWPGFVRFFSPQRLVLHAGVDLPAVAPRATAFDPLARLGDDCLHYARYFCRLLLTRRVEVRWCLPVLSSLKYSLPIEADVTGHRLRPDETDVLDQIDALKRDWFGAPDRTAARSALVSLCARACCLLLDSIDRLARRLRDMQSQPDAPVRTLTVPGGRIEFVPDWTPDVFTGALDRRSASLGPAWTSALERLGRLGASPYRLTTVMPIQWLVFFEGGAPERLGRVCSEFIAWRRSVLRFVSGRGPDPGRPIRSLLDCAPQWWRHVGLLESLWVRSGAPGRPG